LFRENKNRAARGKRKEENEPVAKNFSAPPPAGGNALKNLILPPGTDFNGAK
jgi:hypothetical protein